MASPVKLVISASAARAPSMTHCSPSNGSPPAPHSADVIIRDTVHWLERAVIGLNLCPFAKGVYVKDQIHYAVVFNECVKELRDLLRAELLALVAMPVETRETTLLILANCLDDFLDFNDFLAKADVLLEELGLDGTLQIASFHPKYQFAGTHPDDVTNCTNRSPYPTLHLLREESIDRAVEVFPEAELIFERNMATLQALGAQGWGDLQVGAQSGPSGLEARAERKEVR